MESLQHCIQRANATKVLPTGARRNVLTAERFMNRHPLVLSPEMTIERAIAALLQHQISGAPVTTPTGYIVGMLTEMDCVGLVAGNSYHHEGSLSGLCVRDLATPVRVTVEPTTDLFAVVDRFFTTRVRLLPVVDDGVIVGVISRRDVLQVILTL